MTEFRRILVPLDGSVLSAAALPVAEAMAQKFDSELVLLRVVDFPVPHRAALYPEDHWIREALQQEQREVQTYLDTMQHTLEAQGLHARTLVFEESPAEDILFAASSEDVDLIIMTSHGIGGSGRWASGSVAYKVMQHSPCPVLLVRNGEQRGAEVLD